MPLAIAGDIRKGGEPVIMSKRKTVPNKKKYQVVAIVESKRCPIHGAALVSEVIESTDSLLTLSQLRSRKANHCPFC